MALFYLLHLDYPSDYEQGFNIIQNLVFLDKSCLTPIITSVQEMLSELASFREA